MDENLMQHRRLPAVGEYPDMTCHADRLCTVDSPVLISMVRDVAAGLLGLLFSLDSMKYSDDQWEPHSNQRRQDHHHTMSYGSVTIETVIQL